MFLWKVTNSNGDQICQEFLSVKVVSNELWYDTEVAAESVCVHAVQRWFVEVVYSAEQKWRSVFSVVSALAVFSSVAEQR